MLEPPSFSGVSETLLVTLAARGQAARRDPSLRFADPEAERLTGLFDGKLEPFMTDRLTLRRIVLREQWFDAVVLDFAKRHPAGLVVDLGCGLNTGQARLATALPAGLRWANIDLPPVIATRRSLLIHPGETAALDLAADLAGDAWIQPLRALGGPVLFLAQGLLPHLEPAAVESLIRRLAQAFPGARLAFDYCSPMMARLGHRRSTLRRTAAPFRWSLARGVDLKAWVPGLKILRETDPSPSIGLLPALAAGLHWRLTRGRLFYGLAEAVFPAG